MKKIDNTIGYSNIQIRNKTIQNQFIPVYFIIDKRTKEGELLHLETSFPFEKEEENTLNILQTTTFLNLLKTIQSFIEDDILSGPQTAELLSLIENVLQQPCKNEIIECLSQEEIQDCFAFC